MSTFSTFFRSHPRENPSRIQRSRPIYLRLLEPQTSAEKSTRLQLVIRQRYGSRSDNSGTNHTYRHDAAYVALRIGHPVRTFRFTAAGRASSKQYRAAGHS